MQLFSVVLLSLAGVAFGAPGVVKNVDRPMEISNKIEPERCCGPDMWTGEFSQVFDLVWEGAILSTMQSGIMYTDFVGQRMMMNFTVTELRTGYATHNLFYRIGPDTYSAMPQFKSCTKSNATGTLHKCIPKTAVYVGKRKYGDPESGLDADVWFYKETKEGEYSLEGLTAINTASCTPISLRMRNTGPQLPGAPMQGQLEMYNLLGDVKDKSVFDIPSYCEKKSD